MQATYCEWATKQHDELPKAISSENSWTRPLGLVILCIIKNYWLEKTQIITGAISIIPKQDIRVFQDAKKFT